LLLFFASCSDDNTLMISLTIYGATAPSSNGAVAGEEAECSHVGSVELEQSVAGIMQAVVALDECGAEGQADFAQSTGKINLNSAGWTKRY
jgi:hypothetical protein